MRFIRDIHAEAATEKRPVLSVEFFPPKTPEGDRNLLDKTIPALTELPFEFCSVTYGAGGSTKEKTLMIVDSIQSKHQMPSMAHLTCVNATKDQITAFLEEARDKGIKNILALRGDPPGGTGGWKKAEGGFEYSYELVEHIKAFGGFSIGVAGFPEGHIACTEGKHTDWERLKSKVDAGADFIITQLFFDNADFFEFRDYLTGKLGVSVPICPGIITIMNGTQIQRFTSMCGANIPEKLGSKLTELGDDIEATVEFGIDYATKQCEELLKEGAEGLHFYSLNKHSSTTRVIRNLGF